MSAVPYETATDRQLAFLREEFDAFVTERLVRAIREEECRQPVTQVELQALRDFVFVKLAALQAATGPGLRPTGA